MHAAASPPAWEGPDHAMPIHLANAPVSWGIDYPSDPGNPPWGKVMTEIAAAGYRYTELGPYGYYPTDPGVLKAEFDRRGLNVVAGFVFEPLNDPDRADTTLDVASKTVKLLSAVGGARLVMIDHISKERMLTAGRRDLAPRLGSNRFHSMVDLINRIADVALEHDVTPVIHQHAGSYIEFEDEVESLVAALDAQKVSLCVDTGHMVYAGINPVRFYKDHANRVKYFHFKDIDPAVHARILAEVVPFLDAVAQKVFCPMGRGLVNWPGLASAIRDHGYEGAATVEQDIDPSISLAPIDDAKASLAYLRSVGF
jgi:inosose dehydratase